MENNQKRTMDKAPRERSPRRGGGAAHYRYKGQAAPPGARAAGPPGPMPMPDGGPFWEGWPLAGRLAAGAAIALATAALLFALLLSL